MLLNWGFSADDIGKRWSGTVAGSLSVLGETDEFMFEAHAGEAVHIRVVETGGDWEELKVWLYNSDGTLNRDRDDSTAAAFNCYASAVHLVG